MEVKPGTCVYLLDNVISDELCKTIKIIVENTEGHAEDYGFKSNVRSKSVEITEIKNKKFANIIDGEVYDIIKKVIVRVQELNNLIPQISGDSGYCFRKIFGATRLHADTIHHDPDKPNIKQLRCLSLIIALNDDYEGGEFYFPRQDIKIKLKKGQAILFPPYWTHPHGTNELRNNTFRYTINTWLFE
jgi:hypothetical protein